MKVYIIVNKAGEVFDFFDQTWNENIDDCFAPFTTRTDIIDRYWAVRDATLIETGCVQCRKDNNE
jgi:hypothetical protein